MKTIHKFLELHPELELVSNDELHNAINPIAPTWKIFINRMRGVVEVHDTSILFDDELVTSHIMTEQHVTWKIAHDIKKYNSNVFDASRWFEEQDKLQEIQEENSMERKKLSIRKQLQDAFGRA